MLYGMSYQDFWYGDPWMAETYREYYLLKQRKDNEQMWILGAYVNDAVSVAINNCFGKFKTTHINRINYISRNVYT